MQLASRGPGYQVFRSRDEGGQHFGTARLVHAIQHAASSVSRLAPGGVPLRVGDLSARTGGQIPHHRSHRTGRDADLLFFATDAQGHSVPTPAFVRYDVNGRSLDPAHQDLRFDVHRNWLLVASLVRDDSAGIVWIFCADRLRTLLLEHARSIGADEETIARAGELLHQPGDSAPHDDHFHIRVACMPDERARGCRDGGGLGWWLEHTFAKGDAAPLDDDAVLALLADPMASTPVTRASDRTFEVRTNDVARHATSAAGRLATMRAPLAAVTERAMTDAR
jgi:penicillin-insensitive murein endopeptidase